MFFTLSSVDRAAREDLHSVSLATNTVFFALVSLLVPGLLLVLYLLVVSAVLVCVSIAAIERTSAYSGAFVNVAINLTIPC